MVKAKDIIQFIEEQFPDKLRAEWDFTDGIIQGNLNKEIKNVCISLELKDNIIKGNFDMLILHHPPKFGPEKKVSNPFYTKLKNKDIIIYVLHSRIDKIGLINKGLTESIFGKENVSIEKILEDGTIIIKLNQEMIITDFINLIKSKLGLDYVKSIINKNKIKKVAIHGGEGFNPHHINNAINENIDAYLAGDMTHHLAENASFFQINFIDIEHFTEQEGLKKLKEMLESKFNKISFGYIEQKPWWVIK